MSQWSLFVTDRVGNRQAEIDVYETAEIFARTNAVSSWSIVLPTATPAGALFLADSFARLEVRLDGTVWRSGPVAELVRTVDIDGDMLTVNGVDDSVWLARRLAHPQPGTASPPYSTTAYDVHTGTVAVVLGELVNVNAGPGAVQARRVPGLSVPPITPAGPTVTVSARYQNLLALAQDTARPSSMLFDVVGLRFRAYPAADRGVIFSAGLETLAGFEVTAAAATANKIVTAGSGTGTARTIREVSSATSIAQWGLAEEFVDRRDTADTAELDKAGAEALAAGVIPTTVVFAPIDTEAQQFGRDYGLGDLVKVVAGTLTVFDQIREIHVLFNENGVTVTPAVGNPTGDLKLFRALAGIGRRVRQLERI